MRGKPFGGNYKKIRARITPAGAGKTAGCVNCALQAKDHPRRCGENTGLVMSGCAYPGSPPQVRGKHSYFDYSIYCCRITPAGAGKTNQQFRQRNRTEDHPRRCGENLPLLTAARYFLGSPPQVRGKQVHIPRAFVCFGITPAGAGKTLHAELGSAEE